MPREKPLSEEEYRKAEGINEESEKMRIEGSTPSIEEVLNEIMKKYHEKRVRIEERKAEFGRLSDKIHELADKSDDIEKAYTNLTLEILDLTGKMPNAEVLDCFDMAIDKMKEFIDKYK